MPSRYYSVGSKGSNVIIQGLNFSLKKNSAVVLTSLEMGVLSF